MLVLSRKIGEEIVANGVTFRILGVQGGRVRVGIVADPSVPIKRGELTAKEEASAARIDADQGERRVASR